MNYDKDNMSPKLLTALRNYTSMPELASEQIKKVSLAGFYITKWIRAIDAYGNVKLVVGSKTKRLEQLTAEANANK